MYRDELAKLSKEELIALGLSVLMTGVAVVVEPTDYHRERGWIAFELLIGELRATHYNGQLKRPESTLWKAD